MVKNWISGAIQHPGSFKRYNKGHKVTTTTINKGLKSHNKVTHKRAVLAKTLAKMRKMKK
jgi:hypothetical protein